MKKWPPRTREVGQLPSCDYHVTPTSRISICLLQICPLQLHHIICMMIKRWSTTYNNVQYNYVAGLSWLIEAGTYGGRQAIDSCIDIFIHGRPLFTGNKKYSRKLVYLLFHFKKVFLMLIYCYLPYFVPQQAKIFDCFRLFLQHFLRKTNYNYTLCRAVNKLFYKGWKE